MEEKLDWENMVEFAVNLINHAATHRYGSIPEQRFAVMHLDHATELLMKAYLIKECFLISEIDTNKTREGVRRESKVEEYLNKEKTISFRDTFEIIRKKLEISKEQAKTFLKFHKIRNEIQHRALDIPFNKKEEIENFLPSLASLYEKMFPDEWEWGNVFVGEDIVRMKLYKRKMKLR